MDKYELRRQRLIELLEARYAYHGGKSDLAGAAGIQASYVSRLISGEKRLGEDMADKLSLAAGLPLGWFDSPSLSPLSNTQTSNAPLQSEVKKIGAGELDAVISAVLESHGWTLDEYVAIKRRANAQPKRWEHPDMIEEMGQKTKRSRH